ncbi:GAF domain-containing protein [candidate division KSB1 bacterium]
MIEEHVTLPDHIIREWQNIIDIMAAIINVPAGLIMRVVESDIEVFLSSNTEDNPYNVGAKEHLLGSGLYCETVINTNNKLLIPNALTDEHWKNNPDVKLDMISYLGFPILYPDGRPFGTICVLDSKENKYSPVFEQLIMKFRDIVQNNLELLSMNRDLGDENKRLTDYISEIKQLREFIPICASCKKIRDDEGYWHQVETYIAHHTGSQFTHGICPDCTEKLYPGLGKKST